MGAPFRISKQDAGDGTARLTITGDLDRETCEVLTTVVANALREGRVRELVVDLRHVGFLDAMGVRALLIGRETATEHGSGWRVADAHGMVFRVLEVTGLIQKLNVSGIARPHDGVPADGSLTRVTGIA